MINTIIFHALYILISTFADTKLFQLADLNETELQFFCLFPKPQAFFHSYSGGLAQL
jgi:hypothetical protein